MRLFIYYGTLNNINKNPIIYNIEYSLSKLNTPIPQNETSFFIIKKGNWEGSLDILFNHMEELNILNLYIILKSYFYSESYLINFFLVISLNIEDERKISKYHNIEIKKIKKMSFFDFKMFYDSLYDNDFSYIKKNEYYGFRIVFFKQSYFWQNNMIYPVYPWNKSPLSKELDGLINNNNIFQLNIIKKLELENEFLKKKILEQEKIINELEKKVP